MKNSQHHKIVLGLFALLFIATGAKAQRDLIITPYRQMWTNTCWAACGYMVLNAYRVSTTEMDIVRWAFPPNGSNEPNFLHGTPTATSQALRHFGSISSWHDGYNPNTGGGNISQSHLINEIDAGRPILAGRVYYGSNSQISHGHMYVIRGYTGSGGSNVGYVVYNDPATGLRHTQSYAEFVQRGTEYVWYETLRLTTNPRIPIPTSIGPGEFIRINDNNSTAQITQSPQSLTFNAFKYGTPSAINWNWRLVFPHAGGTHTVASWAQSNSSGQSVWNIPNFVLPTGFPWKYNFQGVIPGRVEVWVDDDPAPGPHRDAIDVIYVPSGPLYPGVIVYADRTVSGTHAEFWAHELISIRNVQFLPGSNITFRAGERIDIGDGVNIQNGSNVNFIIDPSIR